MSKNRSLSLNIQADDSKSLRKLLEMALFELNDTITKAEGEFTYSDAGYEGKTDGSMGSYQFVYNKLGAPDDEINF